MAKILIVDDEEHIIMLYQMELESEGYEVTTVADGHELTERIDRDRPNLIVLDIKMAEYNGLELLQEIRNRFFNLPVILCSAYDTYKRDIKSIATDFYVVKSNDLTELKTKILRALQASTPPS